MLAITIQNDKQNLVMAHDSGAIEFGRGPQRPSQPRCIIDDASVSRDHLHVEELPGARLRVQNLSQRGPASLADGTSISPGETRELALPIRLGVGQTRISIAVHSPRGSAAPNTPTTGRDDFASRGFQTIAMPIHAVAKQDVSLPVELNQSPSSEVLTQWMETILALQRHGGEELEFYDQAARAMVSMIGLDVGLVILHRDNKWKVVARAASQENPDLVPFSGREFSQTVLSHVLTERRTFFQDLGLMRSQESLKSVDAVVVSPIFRLGEEMTGVLYGVRHSHGRHQIGKITPLEAQLVQLLAAAVGANLARADATRSRVQFEQFFSPELVRELERDPRLLEGRQQDVTILMSDLRGFSTLSEQLGPEETCRLVRDVLDCQSRRIVEHGGVIVSYLGDGILAMWNAPGKQADHAARACRAALAIQREVPALCAAWQERLGSPIAIGIGINTGPAQVGNTGSTCKFMYGPLGNTVNLASRVEGATKHLKTPILVTGSTHALIGDEFATRRLCKVRVVGIAEPVDLYELYGETASAEWLARRDTYEAGLGQYEAQQWFRACQMLLPLLESAEATGQSDFASLKLMKRCWSCLEEPPEPFDPVLELSSK